MTGIDRKLARMGVPLVAVTLSALAGVAPSAAQGTGADYERARSLRTLYERAAGTVAEPATWIDRTSRFWYRRAVSGGHEFVVVDAATKEKQPAFDHGRLAAALSAAAGGSYTALTLPFARLVYTKDQEGLEVAIDATSWTCDLSTYTCTKRDRRSDGPDANLPRDCRTLPTDTPLASPDGRWEALVQNFNVAIRPTPAAAVGAKDGADAATPAPPLTWLSSDGSDGNCYQLPTLTWSPDSTRLAAMRVRPGFRRIVHYVESTPEDQLQPKHSTRFYAKPGDALDVEQPVIFEIGAKRPIEIERTLFPNAYEISPLAWRKDGRALTFEYNQRGHQVYRVIEVDAVSGRTRALISEEPKTFFYAYSPLQAQAELGFIVVQIDGMGTSNRSKAFHDVAWQNLGDAGFPDRLAWHKALAAKHPWYDISRVGIYGGSAGGQNALGGLLFHPAFYKAAVAYAGCHDNRMDKIWWNEQWMGWPLGPQYAASSNVDHAGRLAGSLLLVVGEMDTNVDPSSTMQVVKALLKANKDFDLLVVPGGGHNAGRGGEFGAYGERKRFDFFVRHLLGVTPPSWNDAAPPAGERAPITSPGSAARPAP